MFGWDTLIYLAITLAISAISYALTPRPKSTQPKEVQQLNEPVSGDGQPVIKVYGSARVAQVAVHTYGRKRVESWNVRV